MPQAPEERRIFNPGDRFLLYQYDIESFLGSGASGQVYGVRHRYTGDRFALKVAHLAERASAAAVARSLVEAQATYRIQHRNVVRVVDLACEPDGMVWQIMELLQGQTLADLLARYGRFSPLHAIDIALEIAWGLHEAHEHQVIHRDVHPRNVFVTSRGEVKVFDFSLAKVIPAGLETTIDSRAKGTIAYMAPEHLKKGRPTPQFDVFALGILLWQMLVGRLPFGHCADNAMVLVDKQLHEDPESLATAAGLPAYCDEVIRGATAKDPRRRHPGMWPLAQALRALRERLMADPAAARVRAAPLWERQHPIARDTESHHQYRPPRSLPGASPVPPVPSRRIVVAQAAAPAPPVPVVRSIAATVPMAAYQGGDPQELAAPTIRRRPPARTRRLWMGLVATAGMAVVGAGLWMALAWGR